MAFNTKEQEIIKWGVENGKTKEEVKTAISNFRSGFTPQKVTPERESFVSDAVSDVKQIGTDIASSFKERRATVQEGKESGQNPLSTLLQTAGQGAGLVSDVIGSLVKGGVKAVLPQGAETGIKEGVKTVAEPIVNSDIVKSVIEKYNSLDPETKRNLDATLGIGSLALDVATLGGGKKIAETGIKTGISLAEKGLEATKPVVSSVVKGAEGILPDSPTILNRIARLKPKDATQFEKLAGESHGSYLSKTGNIGTPDEIIKKESAKFTQSLNDVDNTLAGLEGTFKDGSISDALSGLIEKAKATSGKNIKSPYLDEALSLQKKLKTTGLTMEEINKVKRLYEKNVKLGYRGVGAQINPDAVQKATNIDTALRNWQVGKASELGFTNIAELNKQTQLSKFIIDKLGDQIVGKSGLDGVNLTDWIILSGGEPSSVAGFITKKFLSSKSVQAKIAKLLNTGEVKGQIKPILAKPSTPLLPQKSKSISSVNNTTKKAKKATKTVNN